MSIEIIKTHMLSQELVLRDIAVLKCNRKVMLVGIEYGTTIIIDDRLFLQLKNNQLSDDMLLKLIQHGLAYNCDTPKPALTADKICPSFFIIELTDQCNFGCKYCFRDRSSGEKKLASDASIDRTVKTISRYCRQNHIEHITVQPWGGEPLIHFDGIMRLYNGFRKENISCKITLMTNASLITEEMGKQLRSINADIGISLDGGPDIQNSQRPYANEKASFADTIKGIENLKKAGYPLSELGTISVITKESVHKTSEIIRFLAQNIGIRSIKLNIVRSTPQISLSDDEIELFCNSMTDTLLQLYHEGITVVEGNIKDRLLNLIDRSNNNICNAFGCCGGRRMLTIDTQGNIFPCEKTDVISERLGAASEDTDLRQIVCEAIDKHPYFRKKYSAECQSCPWWSFCRGGCTTAVQYYGDKPGSVDRLTCKLNRVLYPMLAKLILNEPDTAEALAGRR